MRLKKLISPIVAVLKDEGAQVTLIISFLSSYFIFRPLLTASMTGVFAVIYIFKILFSLYPRNNNLIKNIQKINIRYILYPAVFVYLVLTAFNFRVESVDGLNFSYRIAYFVKENSRLVFLNAPPKPFLFEFIMGLLWKFVNLNVLSLIMGIIGLLATYTTYILIKTYKPQANSKKQRIYLLLACCNPIFLSLLIFQFKPDLLALILTNLAFICYIKFVRTKSSRFLYLLAVNLGIVLLVKVLYAIVVGPIIIATLLYLIKTYKLKSAVRYSASFLIIWIIPISIWLTIFGVTIPKFENYLSFGGLVKSNTLQLEYDKDVYKQCNRERIVKDYASIIGAPRNILGKIFQPIFFIHMDITIPEHILTLSDTGPFIYLGLITFLIGVKRLHKEKTYLDFSINLVILTALIMFYINVAHVLWYILFAFPFLSIYFWDYLEKININLRGYVLYRTIIIYLITITLIASLALIIDSSTFFIFDTRNLSRTRTFKKDEIYNSGIIEKYSAEGIIFDATVHPFGVNYPLVPNSYSRIYANPYFFAATNLSSSEIRDYLELNNIKYMIATKDNLLNEFWYSGCTLDNNRRLIEFLDQNATPVSDPDINFLYVIKN